MTRTPGGLSSHTPSNRACIEPFCDETLSHTHTYGPRRDYSGDPFTEMLAAPGAVIGAILMLSGILSVMAGFYYEMVAETVTQLLSGPSAREVLAALVLAGGGIFIAAIMVHTARAVWRDFRRRRRASRSQEDSA